MLRRLAIRLGGACGVLLVVAALAFTVARYAGDPAANMLGQEVSAEDRARLTCEIGLCDPVPVQFAHFLGRALSGEFGTSLRTRQEVGPLILSRLAATLELVLVATCLAHVLGIALGVLAAARPDSIPVRLAMGLTLFGVSLPVFVIGVALIQLFAVELRWLPSSGRGGTSAPFGWTSSLFTAAGWRSLALPAATLTIFQTAVIARLVRAAMAEALASDFVRFARSRGLSRAAILWREALPHALGPVAALAGVNVGGLIAYSMVTETMFQWPGLGFLFLESVAFADIPVIAAFLCLAGLVFVITNLMAQGLAAFLDPRLRRGAP